MDPEDQHIGQVSSRIGFFIIWLHASDGQSKDVKQCPPSGVSVIEYLALHSNDLSNDEHANAARGP